MAIFETQDLIVRRLKESDLNGFHEMQSNPNVLRYATGKLQDKPGNHLELLRCIAAYDVTDNRFRIWAVEEKSSGRFVGTCAVVAADEFQLRGKKLPRPIDEIGYRFLESEWGKGWGRQVADGLIDHCMLHLPSRTLIAQCDSRNTASVKILEGSPLGKVDADNPDCFSGANTECDLHFLWIRNGND